jgi:hypothetical protein
VFGGSGSHLLFANTSVIKQIDWLFTFNNSTNLCNDQLPLSDLRVSTSWQCAITSLRQRHLWPALVLTALLIVGLLLRNMWWLVGSFFTSCFRTCTCNKCNHNDLVEFHPLYLRALESGRLRGLPDYNIFTNPVYQVGSPSHGHMGVKNLVYRQLFISPTHGVKNLVYPVFVNDSFLLFKV